MGITEVQKVSQQASVVTSEPSRESNDLTTRVDEAASSVQLRPEANGRFEGTAFHDLTGVLFNEETTPPMEYLVHALLEEVQELSEEGFSEDMNLDFQALEFVLADLQEQAPKNLQPVLKKCLAIAREKNAPQELTQFLEKKLEGLIEAPFQSSATLGLPLEEMDEPVQDWSRIAMIGTAFMVGIFALSYLFGGASVKASEPSRSEAPAPSASSQIPKTIVNPVPVIETMSAAEMKFNSPPVAPNPVFITAIMAAGLIGVYAVTEGGGTTPANAEELEKGVDSDEIPKTEVRHRRVSSTTLDELIDIYNKSLVPNTLLSRIKSWWQS